VFSDDLPTSGRSIRGVPLISSIWCPASLQGRTVSLPRITHHWLFSRPYELGTFPIPKLPSANLSCSLI